MKTHPSIREVQAARSENYDLRPGLRLQTICNLSPGCQWNLLEAGKQWSLSDEQQAVHPRTTGRLHPAGKP